MKKPLLGIALATVVLSIAAAGADSAGPLPACDEEALSPDEIWAGRRAHLAVVNPAVPADDGSVLSLRGEWEFAAGGDVRCAHVLGFGEAANFFGQAGVWKNVRKVNVSGCWDAQMSDAFRARKWDVTDLVTPGKPFELMIEANNAYPFRNGCISAYHRWGGLVRDVELEATPADVCIDEAWVSGDLHVRDPFVVTDRSAGRYYLVSSAYAKAGEPCDRWFNRRGGGVWLYESKDLKTWKGPRTILSLPSELKCESVWAPELHRWKGNWYLFATLNQEKGVRPIAAMAEPGETVSEKNLTARGTWVFRSEGICGPYRRVKDGPLPPEDRMTLDGTLVTDGGKPFMAYCHEWCQTGNGLMECLPLSDDLSSGIGSPVRMFDAKGAMKGAGFVTDGPFFYRSPTSGILHMIWSNLVEGHGYCVLMRRSASGRLAGPWSKDEILYGENGGHGMIFETLEGRPMLVLHSPDQPSGSERMRFIELAERDGKLCEY